MFQAEEAACEKEHALCVQGTERKPGLLQYRVRKKVVGCEVKRSNGGRQTV